MIGNLAIVCLSEVETWVMNSKENDRTIYFANEAGNHEGIVSEEAISTFFPDYLSVILGRINPENDDVCRMSDDEMQRLTSEVVTTLSNAKAQLVDGMVGKAKIVDKQEFVQLNQSFLIQQLNRLYVYRQSNRANNQLVVLYTTISRKLQKLLNFIEAFFGNYFDHSENVPTFYLAICKEEMSLQLQGFLCRFQKSPAFERRMVDTLSSSLLQFGYANTKPVSYSQLYYQKDLLNELASEKWLVSNAGLREMLYQHNFNEPGFIDYEYERLNELMEAADTKAGKIAMLRLEQKSINQLAVLLNYSYSASMPSLKEQINGWINEEIKYLQDTETTVKPEMQPQLNENKIHTSLSVAKLALILRLLVIDKIIINRTVAPMLRVAAKIFTTLQREEVSFGSLETKYHAPDKATINAVKDMLFKWINILNRL